MINIAVIGAGKNCQKLHLPVLEDMKNSGKYNLSLLCDLNEELLKEVYSKFGFEKYTSDAEEIFERKDIVAVYIFGTAKMHYEYAKKAVLSGKHVFVEKPPAPDTASMLEIIKLAKHRKVICAVGFNRRFRKNINLIKESLGGSRISSIESNFDKPALNKDVPYGGRSWLSANAIHSFDVITYLMEEAPIEMHSATNSVSGEAPQNFSVLLKWRDGTHATITSNNSAGRRREVYLVNSLGKTYECDDLDFKSYDDDGTEIKQEVKKSNEGLGIVGEHKEFYDSIVNNREPINSFEKTIMSLYLVELAESGYSGKIKVIKTSEKASDNEIKKAKEVVELDIKEKSILVLNSESINLFLPRLAEKYKLCYDIPQDKKSVVAVITGRGGTQVTKEMLEQLPNLSVVGIVGASVKKYNPEMIIGTGIPIINVSEVYADVVAEFVLMQAIAGVRNAVRSHDIMKRGGWGVRTKSLKEKGIGLAEKIGRRPFVKPFRKLLIPVWKKIIKNQTNGKNKLSFTGCKIGIIGYGTISKKFIKLLKPFNCQIRVYSDYLTEEEATLNGIKKTSLSEVLNSDVVSVHRGLSDRTKLSIGKIELEGLKQGAVFINTSRGEIIDELALIERLKKGDVYACLDVFEKEPLAKGSKLRKLDNVFLTSHLSGSTSQLYSLASKKLVEKIINFLDKKKVDSVIESKELLDNMT